MLMYTKLGKDHQFGNWGSFQVLFVEAQVWYCKLQLDDVQDFEESVKNK